MPSTENEVHSNEPGEEGLGRRDRKKLNTRAALANAALELFETRGLASTTIDDITERADVSRRTFFRYFPTKEATLLPDPSEFERQVPLVLATKALPLTISDILEVFIEAANAVDHDPDLELRRVAVLLDNQVEVAWVAWQAFSTTSDSIVGHIASHTGMDADDAVLKLAVSLGVFIMTFSLVTWSDHAGSNELAHEYHRNIEVLEALVNHKITFG